MHPVAAKHTNPDRPFEVERVGSKCADFHPKKFAKSQPGY